MYAKQNNRILSGNKISYSAERENCLISCGKTREAKEM